MRRAVIAGTGSYLPEQILTNAQLAEKVDTTDEWIVERTGIRSRHIAKDDETTGDIAVKAARAALENAKMDPNEIDLIILATSTPDHTFPATAALVQSQLGITGGAAFDVQAVCSGFVYAMTTANALVRCGQANNVLVIGAETFSRLLDWEDRTTCVLFGDGAGAVILRAKEVSDGEGEGDDQGIIACRVRSDGRHYDKLYVDGGPSSSRTVGHLRMSGREVFKHAVNNISSVMEEVLQEAKVDSAEIDWFVPHQANLRILKGTARKFGIPDDKIVLTLDRHGNTSAASIPLALDEAHRDGRIKPGHMVLLEAMGGGFTWGAVLLRW